MKNSALKNEQPLPAGIKCRGTSQFITQGIY